jgi:hypothetical protein
LPVCKFCSRKYEKSLDNPAQRLKIKKTCPHCTKTFHPITIKQVYCGHCCAGKQRPWLGEICSRVLTLRVDG